MERPKEKIEDLIEYYKNKLLNAHADHDSMFYGYQDHLSGIIEGLTLAKEILEE